MPFEVIVTSPACRDLRLILDSKEEDDPDYAARLHHRLTNFIHRLGEQPFVGDIIKRTPFGIGRETFVRPYRIYFVVNEDMQKVYIQRIRHARRGNLKSME